MGAEENRRVAPPPPPWRTMAVRPCVPSRGPIHRDHASAPLPSPPAASHSICTMTPPPLFRRACRCLPLQLAKCKQRFSEIEKDPASASPEEKQNLIKDIRQLGHALKNIAEQNAKVCLRPPSPAQPTTILSTIPPLLRRGTGGNRCLPKGFGYVQRQ